MASSFRVPGNLRVTLVSSRISAPVDGIHTSHTIAEERAVRHGLVQMALWSETTSRHKLTSKFQFTEVALQSHYTPAAPRFGAGHGFSRTRSCSSVPTQFA